MVFFNYTTMEMSAKIVYYGPGLCGKTTNLQYIYDHLPRDRRGEMVSLPTETDRTLFFDLLPLRLGKVGGFTTRLQLYTVPGQVFYNSTRKLVLKGLDAVVFVADSQTPMLDANIESLENLQENLRDLKLDLRNIPWVIQYNKRDLPNILQVQELEKHLNFMNVPSFESIAITGEGVIESLKGISKLTLQHLKKKAGYDAEPEADEPETDIVIGAEKERSAAAVQPPVAPPPEMAPEAPATKSEALELEEVEISDSLELESELLEVEELPEELDLQTGEGMAFGEPEDLALELGTFEEEEVAEEEEEIALTPPAPEAAEEVKPEEEVTRPEIELAPEPEGLAHDEEPEPEPASEELVAPPEPEPAEVAASSSDEEPLTVVKNVRVPVRITKAESLRGVRVEVKIHVDCYVSDTPSARHKRTRSASAPSEDSRVTRALQDLRRLGAADSPIRRRRSR